MVDPIKDFFDVNLAQLLQAFLLGLTGMTIGVANLLRSSDSKTFGKIVGHAIIAGGIGMTAGTVLLWFPNTPLVAQLGIAAGLSNLGLEGVKLMIARTTK